MVLKEELAEQIRTILVKEPGFEEKRMFGGIGFLLHGNMVCGIHKEFLIARIGPEQYSQALTQPHVKEFDMSGHPMAGWVMVAPEGYAQKASLQEWVGKGVKYVSGLPAKKK